MKTRHEWVTAIGYTIVVKDKQIIWKREGCKDVNYWCSENGAGKVLGAEILRLAGELEDATTWMPIETAPRDGTWILVWEADYECPMSAQWGLLNINPNKYDGVHGWSGYGYIFSNVTHWMPMPAMPLEQSDTPKKHQNSDTTE